ncbi:hypothetical protein ACNI4F_14395 [Enterobacter hormaechei]|uniref:hypothetical protein n=1 Tax=Enterobacter hormaechei TaxID=158836 RepID=UPI001BE02DFD|nr:hypothetical protein [Enterobacter hormaechei]EKK5437049.1 hypothetical protein [Enterobacter hormaechei]MBT1944226.1 hypothetical protein [Enterobacter hormaechei subsp. xiangfangensis]MCE1606817.1 hypothetical protein [Enterobacter hormaechei]MCE1619713.1 hypothetical protein [Enterobacter hormaechei]MDR9902660.1 hypothetical protein [Enterobacter hormaechei subsp. xiangfangensis]
MKIHFITIALLATISSPSYAAFQKREYNTWYQKDAVLYDITQTSEGLPVMISISQPGRESANMLVSYMSDGGCGDEKVRLNANGKDVPATYTCVSVGADRIEHFAVNDASKVNEMVNHLKSDFTLLLQNDIKVWAANIKTPKYGLAPKF